MNKKFTIDDAEKNGNSTNDFAVIHLPTNSQIQPIPLLSPLQSIHEFLDSTQTAGFQCEEVGFGLDANKEPMNIRSGEINTENIVMSLTFEQNPKGMITNGQQVVLSKDSDIQAYAALDAKRIMLMRAGKDESAEDVTIQQLLFLNSLKLIKNSIMPGDSGGPLLCRHDAGSAWKVVGVASTMGLPASVVIVKAATLFSAPQFAAMVDKDGHLPIELSNTWGTPDLNEITTQIWAAH